LLKAICTWGQVNKPPFTFSVSRLCAVLCTTGVSVDRILGEVALLEGDWHRAEQAFEDGLALCRRVNNQPEEAAILYEAG